MKSVKKIVTTILDVIELHIPVLLFTAVFVMYIIMIFYRYVFHKAVFPMNEACQILYLTCALLGASHAGRTDSHVIFPLLYDNLKPKVQRVFRMISDVIIVVLCIILWWPTMKSLIWMNRKKTEVLDVPFSWMYAIFELFLTLSCIYYIYHFIKDLKTPKVD